MIVQETIVVSCSPAWRAHDLVGLQMVVSENLRMHNGGRDWQIDEAVLKSITGLHLANLLRIIISGFAWQLLLHVTF